MWQEVKKNPVETERRGKNHVSDVMLLLHEHFSPYNTLSTFKEIAISIACDTYGVCNTCAYILYISIYIYICRLHSNNIP